MFFFLFVFFREYYRPVLSNLIRINEISCNSIFQADDKTRLFLSQILSRNPVNSDRIISTLCSV